MTGETRAQAGVPADEASACIQAELAMNLAVTTAAAGQMMRARLVYIPLQGFGTICAWRLR
jgi:hypothetical protein